MPSRVAYREDFGPRTHSVFGALGLRPPVAQHSRAEAELLRRIGAGARSIVEIGVAEGGSAWDVRQVMDPAGTLYLIDPFPRVAGVNLSSITARRLVNSVDRGNVVWLEQFSAEAAVGWEQDIDLLFIDGDHSYEATKDDFETWSPFVVDGGAIAFHDALLDAPWMSDGFGSARFVAELRASDGPWKLDEQADSLGVFRRR